jgi:hypothetical protein
VGVPCTTQTYVARLVRPGRYKQEREEGKGFITEVWRISWVTPRVVVSTWAPKALNGTIDKALFTNDNFGLGVWGVYQLIRSYK